MSRTITVHGYQEYFPRNVDANIFLGEEKIGTVGHHATTEVSVPEGCTLQFKIRRKSAQCQINPDTTDVLLSVDRWWGKISATAIDKSRLEDAMNIHRANAVIELINWGLFMYYILLFEVILVIFQLIIFK